LAVHALSSTADLGGRVGEGSRQRVRCRSLCPKSASCAGAGRQPPVLTATRGSPGHRRASLPRWRPTERVLRLPQPRYRPSGTVTAPAGPRSLRRGSGATSGAAEPQAVTPAVTTAASAVSTCAVIQSASAEARLATAGATSSGVPSRLTGYVEATSSSFPS